MAKDYCLSYVVSAAVLDRILKRSEIKKVEFVYLAAAEMLCKKEGKFQVAKVAQLIGRSRRDQIYKAFNEMMKHGYVERVNQKKVWHGNTNDYIVTGKGSYLVANYEKKIKEKIAEINDL